MSTQLTTEQLTQYLDRDWLGKKTKSELIDLVVLICGAVYKFRESFPEVSFYVRHRFVILCVVFGIGNGTGHLGIPALKEFFNNNNEKPAQVIVIDADKSSDDNSDKSSDVKD